MGFSDKVQPCQCCFNFWLPFSHGLRKLRQHFGRQSGAGGGFPQDCCGNMRCCRYSVTFRLRHAAGYFALAGAELARLPPRGRQADGKREARGRRHSAFYVPLRGQSGFGVYGVPFAKDAARFRLRQTSDRSAGVRAMQHEAKEAARLCLVQCREADVFLPQNGSGCG